MYDMSDCVNKCVCVLTCQLHCSGRTPPERFTTPMGQGIGGGRWGKGNEGEG